MFWHSTLTYDPSYQPFVGLKGLGASEDQIDLNLGPLHRIVVGLSCANLAEQIEQNLCGVDDTDWSGATALMWAAWHSNVDHIVTLLAYNARVDKADMGGSSVLHAAAESGSLDCVLALLRANADPNMANNDGRTPLHNSLYNRKNRAVIAALIEHGADIEPRTTYTKFTPLHEAILKSFGWEIVKFLLEYGADINALWKDEDTPISLAIFMNETRTIQLLASMGASSSWKTLRGENNIVKEAAVYATANTMRVLAETELAPIICSLEDIQFLFNDCRNRNRIDLQRSYRGESYEEEEDALMFLIGKKVILTDDEYIQAFGDAQAMSDETESGENEDIYISEEDEIFVDASEEITV